jgi:hypothetical protein
MPSDREIINVTLLQDSLEPKEGVGRYCCFQPEQAGIPAGGTDMETLI